MTRFLRLIPLAALLCLSLLAWRPWSAAGEDPPPVDKAVSSQAVAQAEVQPAETPLQDLKKARLDVARKAFEAVDRDFLAGRGTLEFTMNWSERLLKAELAVADKPNERRAARERHIARLRAIEEVNKQRFDAGRIAVQDYLSSQYNRLDAEIDLAEHSNEQKPKK
jgi:hypothetical protein